MDSREIGIFLASLYLNHSDHRDFAIYKLKLKVQIKQQLSDCHQKMSTGLWEKTGSKIPTNYLFSKFYMVFIPPCKAIVSSQ